LSEAAVGQDPGLTGPSNLSEDRSGFLYRAVVEAISIPINHQAEVYQQNENFNNLNGLTSPFFTLE
jgi:hypothetical protein